MSDFKGRKDFPEVADDKIKIGDYSGWNRLSVVDIYSPKAEPELRDRMMEPIKGKINTYDSPILSQQPVIVLSDDASEEALLIKAIDGYMGEETVSSLSENSMSDLEPRKKPKPKKSKFGQRAYVAQQEATRQQAGPADSYAKADTIEKKVKDAPSAHRLLRPGSSVIPVGQVGAGATKLGLRTKGTAGPVTSYMPGGPEYDKKLAEMEARTTANPPQGGLGAGKFPTRPLVSPKEPGEVAKARGTGKRKPPMDPEPRPSPMDVPGVRPDRNPQGIMKSAELEEGFRSWSYQG